LIGAVQNHIPIGLLNMMPDRYRVIKQNQPEWLKTKPNGQPNIWPGSLQESLYLQVTEAPLPSLLRYEDRNSMAFSIESRVPFMDYRLIEFTLGLPEKFVYYRGERKHILRKSFNRLIPDEVLNRRDKMGFVSPEEKWLKEEGQGWFTDQILKAGENLPEIINKEKVINMLANMTNNKTNFNSSPWHILSMNRFINMTKV
jgi:asparagine synthase (glutamine-hydrolysing)